MEEFGTYLKSQREKKGIRLEEIASITKIHLHNLELLESGQLEQLPPEPFLRGFITAYAKYVGLSPKETIDKYLQCAGLEAEILAESTTAPAVVHPKAQFPKGMHKHTPGGMSSNSSSIAAPPGSNPDVVGKFQLPSWPKLVTAAGVFFVAGISLLLIQVGKNADAPSEVAGVPTQVEMVAENTPTENADARSVAANTQPPPPLQPATPPSPTTASPAPSTAPLPAVAGGPLAPANAAHVVEIEGAERTWVKVVIDSEPPTEFFLSPGKKVQYTAQQKIKVVLGNSTGTKVLHNGSEAEGKRFMGTIRSFRFPANAQFPQDIPKPTTPLTPAAATEGDGDKTE
jgi:cytoskeleton protein RodZ